jgi:hypothetical protein
LELDRFVRRRVRRARLVGAVAAVVLLGLAIGWFATRPPAPPARPTTPDGLLDRGLESLAKDPGAAERDIADAHRLRPDERSAALLGLCRSKAANHEAAVAWYRQAIGAPGVRPAWVHNNLAYSLVQGPAKPAAFQQAIVAATEALRLDPSMLAANWNRAWARLRAGLDKKSRRVPAMVAAEIDADLQEVLSADPPVAELYYLAAQVYAASAADQPARYETAVKYLHRAVDLGLPPVGLSDDAIFKHHLAGRADFGTLVSRPAGPKLVDSLSFRLIVPPAR